MIDVEVLGQCGGLQLLPVNYRYEGLGVYTHHFKALAELPNIWYCSISCQQPSTPSYKVCIQPEYHHNIQLRAHLWSLPIISKTTVHCLTLQLCSSVESACNIIAYNSEAIFKSMLFQFLSNNEDLLPSHYDSLRPCLVTMKAATLPNSIACVRRLNIAIHMRHLTGRGI